MRLSISIFRRFSLFLRKYAKIIRIDELTFNLHFQEIFFVSTIDFRQVEKVTEPFNLHFQEIFFVSRFSKTPYTLSSISPFNLHFQEIFFVSELNLTWYLFSNTWLSISIFRRFSLFHFRTLIATENEYETFNLHFQEIFFVSHSVHSF